MCIGTQIQEDYLGTYANEPTPTLQRPFHRIIHYNFKELLCLFICVTGSKISTSITKGSTIVPRQEEAEGNLQLQRQLLFHHASSFKDNTKCSTSTTS